MGDVIYNTKSNHINHEKGGFKNGIKQSLFSPQSVKKTKMEGLNSLSGQTNQETQTSTANDDRLEEVIRIAKLLSSDHIGHITRGSCSINGKFSKYCQTLERTAKELSEKHDILFNSMVTRLKNYENNGYESFKSVIDEIFQDRNFNWGRIVTVYTFGGVMAKYYYDNKRYEDVQKVSDFIGLYVGNKLGGWICSQGGWDAFVEYFPDPRNGENTVWRGLLFTAVGLGALGALVAAR